MDETMVSNVKDRKKGVGVNRKRKKRIMRTPPNAMLRPGAHC